MIIKYKKLTPRRKVILEMRMQGKSYQEIGDKLRISKERIRQIIEKLEDFIENYKKS